MDRKNIRVFIGLLYYIAATRKPPSTGMQTPVTKPEARGLARNSRAPASSAAVPEAAERGALDDRPPPRGQPAGFLVHQQGPVLLAQEEARGDGVDPDAVRCQLARVGLRLVQHAGLGRVVAPDPGKRHIGGHGGDVDDRALLLPLDPAGGENLGGHQQAGHQVQPQHLLEASASSSSNGRLPRVPPPR